EAVILKTEPAAVAEEDIGVVLEVGDEERRPAAAIQIAGLDPHAGDVVAGAGQAAAGEKAFLDEPASTLVVEQVLWFEVVGYINIEAAVAVEIDHEDAQARGRGRGGDA